MLAWQNMCTNTFVYGFEVFNLASGYRRKKNALFNRLDPVLWNKDKISLATATLIKIKLFDLMSYLFLMCVTFDLFIYQLLVILKKEEVSAVFSSL